SGFTSAVLTAPSEASAHAVQARRSASTACMRPHATASHCLLSTMSANPDRVPILIGIVAEVDLCAPVGVHQPNLFAPADAVAPPDDLSTVRRPTRMLVPFPRRGRQLAQVGAVACNRVELVVSALRRYKGDMIAIRRKGWVVADRRVFV